MCLLLYHQRGDINGLFKLSSLMHLLLDFSRRVANGRLVLAHSNEPHAWQNTVHQHIGGGGILR
jgi:hypothetical protein